MAPLIRIASLVACLLVLIGFAMFAADEADRGSREQQSTITGRAEGSLPGTATERERERAHGAARELVDDANDVLLAPFDGIVDSDDAWVNRLLPAALALLCWGFGLSLLANSLPGGTTRQRDWREQAS
jgi:hypothetical protein